MLPVNVTRILVTGANGHLGRRLINALPAEHEIHALVRSTSARQSLLTHAGTRRNLHITVVDPGDVAAVTEVASQCERAVHLIGMIKESKENRYADSHQRPTQALADAAPNTALEQIVYVSILGADDASACRCLRARAAVEGIFKSAKPAATIIRVPMVLGEKDRASYALAKRAAAKRVTVFRAASLEQPIYAGDVISAIGGALEIANPEDQVFDLAGPQSLSRRELITRAAALLDNRPAIYSLPLCLGMALAGLSELALPDPRVTRDMLRVLDHDDAIDPLPAAAALGLNLTPLQETLRRCIVGRLRHDAT